MTLKKPKFTYLVSAEPKGGSTLGGGYSVSECIAAGLNHAQFFLRADALAQSPERTHVKVRVEVLCATCSGDGRIPSTLRHKSKPCPDCRGGLDTSPISGTTAIELDVYPKGAAHAGAMAKCECSEPEGEVGGTCGRCARGRIP